MMKQSPTKQSLVMTVIGKDHPGLVESLSAIIEEHGGNWEESRMVHLAGQFAGLVHVHVPELRATGLETALGGLDGLSVVVARAPDEQTSAADALRLAPSGTNLLELEVEGQDHPGIVHRVAEAVAAKGINVEELETELSAAPMTGQKMFRARARLRAPKSVSLEDLTEDLEDLAADLMVEVRAAE